MANKFKTNAEFRKNCLGKLENEKDKYKYKYYCKCSHPIHIYPMEHVEFKICTYCGHRVYRDPKEQKKYDFKLKMRSLL